MHEIPQISDQLKALGRTIQDGRHLRYFGTRINLQFIWRYDMGRFYQHPIFK